ncbi:MAG: 16S rRNA (adenine(1518)-N(6)/adenine(1519)-N(6))-dimethyltransferase RsmA [Candidatus Pacebacteria bacterium]|nr:16S rRNA (adenine(1518)-N(6)/adenine(1519)-N(6))-dimethyltransferase RsmA [Candidatus Paceibacterota bacterium]
MNLSSIKNIKYLLKKYRIQPSKGLGQNFLIDKAAVRKVVMAAELEDKDLVLEIGPGLGVLTEELAQKAKKVIAVEKDRKMMEIMKETLGNFNNIEVIQGDILKSKLQIPDGYKVVANLPFYLTAPVIRKFLETENPPKEMILIIQKEVGQRITARPPEMSILAVAVQVYSNPKIISYISKKSFWPQPKVDSAIIKITPLEKLLGVDYNKFFLVVKAGFSQPRKQLANNLSKKLNLNRVKTEQWLSANSIQPSQRAETLTLDDWIKLAKTIKIN